MPGDFLEHRADGDDRPEIYLFYCMDCGKEIIGYREGTPVNLRCPECFLEFYKHEKEKR
jgi:DNA-directed RNA polymerase subunit RPC12/RpoP